jgi:hypothetical protein
MKAPVQMGQSRIAMTSPNEVVERIRSIINGKSDDAVKTLIAIHKELEAVDYMNEWNPRDAAYWATKPASRRETRVHAFIQDHGFQQGLKWGAIGGALVVGFAWLMSG